MCEIAYMCERLRKLIREYVIKAGDYGKDKLAEESGVSVSLINLVERDGHIPRPTNVYKLAKACGLTEDEALELASEYAPSSDEGQQTA